MSANDWTYRPGQGEASVAIYEGGAFELRPTAVVSWKGDRHLVPHVPSAYFDKVFCNLRNDRPAAADLLERVVRFVDGMNESDWNSFLASDADSERLTIAGKNGMPLPPAVLRKEGPGKAFAQVRAKMIASAYVLGATTHFKPIFRGQNPTVAEIGFWALWDWMILYLLDAQEFDVLARSFNSFVYQLNHYRSHGIPSFRDMGSVPLLAVLHQADDDEPPRDAAELIARIHNELADAATSEDGTPLAFPDWAIRQFVKSQIVSEFGLLDEQVTSALTVMQSADESHREEARARYEAELDRILETNGLASIVPSVIAAVVTREPDEAV